MSSIDGKTFNKLRKRCPYYKLISPGPGIGKQHLCFMSGDVPWEAKLCSFRRCGFMYWKDK